MRDPKKWGIIAVGLLSGFLVLAAAHRYGLSVDAAVTIPLMVLLAGVSIVDMQRKMIPDWLTLPGLLWVLGTSAIWGWPRVADALLGLLLCGGSLLIFAVISRGAVGGGDVKLMAIIGASLGWQWGFGVLAFAQLSAALLALCLFITGRRGGKDTLPFGPFLTTFAMLAMVGRPMQ
jgi:prepilin signal peptidase PulO-like enzyme (type II secretory pathway)